ncbi:hypothetical protein CAP47_07055 [Psychroflexus sp. S27]|uniref:ATPase n=1 Tax=Psychroflexus sp. S27 TaxID=1982757 RepID=UPI000C2AD3CE|nr:ATPase [Psychroflexus sp. S27]PJX22777.1 hypothetical protein CAP47_07055 [Psychroflexus sp. S27]
MNLSEPIGKLIKAANGKEFCLAVKHDNHLHYSLKEVVNFLTAKGKERFGDHFKIYPTDHELIYKLCILMIQDKRNAKRLHLNLNKGVLLSGPVGVGKTSIMQLISEICHQKPEYKTKTAREITFAYNENGSKIISQYGNQKSYCFDDLGLEPTGRFYGKDANVMAEVLLSRHELYTNYRTKPKFFLKRMTHITTNLNASEIEERYGKRVRSKLREMLNLIAFHPNTKDKR